MITTSKDGTRIAFEVKGNGPPLILVASALADRSDAAKLASLLAATYTVINYDRRGRGASADTPPYAIERECEDIDALVAVAGGSAFLFGSSSGAALALEAAARVPAIQKLALFEPPFFVDETGRRPPADLSRRIDDLLAANRRGGAVRTFMKEGIGVPGAIVWMMRLMPRTWSSLVSMAHTIPYDIALVRDNQRGKPLPTDRWTSVSAPTLVLDGSKSPPSIRHAAEALAHVLPNAHHRTVPAVSHSALMMAPQRLVPVLREFLGA